MDILTKLSDLEILTRSQIQSLFNIPGVRNANYIMQSLKEYTRSVFVGENAYYLNKRGRLLVGAKKQFRVSDQLTHKLMRNDAYIYFRPTDWRAEMEIGRGNISVIPDAFFFSGSSYKFLEVDNEQRWHVNKRKFEEYRQLKDANLFQRDKRFRKFPTLVWIVKYDSRIPKLKELAKESKIACKVYSHKEVVL